MPLGNLKYEDLSENQQQFVDDAEDQGLDVRDYSGRAMGGKLCPAVVVDDPLNDFRPTARNLSQDRMGKAYVIYCIH